MLISAEDLAGPGDLAREHNVDLATINYWRKVKETFPKPVAELSNGPVFSAEAVRAWVKDYRKVVPSRPRRPRRFTVMPGLSDKREKEWWVWDRQREDADCGPYTSRAFARTMALQAEQHVLREERLASAKENRQAAA